MYKNKKYMESNKLIKDLWKLTLTSLSSGIDHLELLTGK